MPHIVPNRVQNKEDYYRRLHVQYCIIVATALCSAQHFYTKEGVER